MTRLSSPVFEVGISPSPIGTADAALARDNDNPAAPNTGRALLRFVFEAFEFDMGESSTPFWAAFRIIGVDLEEVSARASHFWTLVEAHCSPHAECCDGLHGIGKAITPNRLRQHRGSRYHLVDTSERFAISASGEKLKEATRDNKAAE